MIWTNADIPFYFNKWSVSVTLFAVKLRFVLRKSISSFGLLPTDVAVPEEVSRKVNALEVVLHVHLPTMAEPTTRALIAALCANDILKEVFIASHKWGVKACTTDQPMNDGFQNKLFNLLEMCIERSRFSQYIKKLAAEGFLGWNFDLCFARMFLVFASSPQTSQFHLKWPGKWIDSTWFWTFIFHWCRKLPQQQAYPPDVFTT